MLQMSPCQGQNQLAIVTELFGFLWAALDYAWRSSVSLALNLRSTASPLHVLAPEVQSSITMSHCLSEGRSSPCVLSCPQVVNPRMHAHLYTWGAGHATAEGERLPVKVRCFCPCSFAHAEGVYFS